MVKHLQSKRKAQLPELYENSCDVFVFLHKPIEMSKLVIGKVGGTGGFLFSVKVDIITLPNLLF